MKKLKVQAHESLTAMHKDLVQYMSETASEEEDW